MNSKYEILNHLYFGLFFFSGTALWRFNRIFLRQPAMVANIFIQPPNDKKASYDPAIASHPGIFQTNLPKLETFADFYNHV